MYFGCLVIREADLLDSVFPRQCIPQGFPLAFYISYPTQPRDPLGKELSFKCAHSSGTPAKKGSGNQSEPLFWRAMDVGCVQAAEEKRLMQKKGQKHDPQVLELPSH